MSTCVFRIPVRQSGESIKEVNNDFNIQRVKMKRIGGTIYTRVLFLKGELSIHSYPYVALFS